MTVCFFLARAPPAPKRDTGGSSLSDVGAGGVPDVTAALDGAVGADRDLHILKQTAPAPEGIPLVAVKASQMDTLWA